MTEEQLRSVNAIISDMHDDVANIGEEIIDRCNDKAGEIAEGLIKKIRHLKRNLKKDEL